MIVPDVNLLVYAHNDGGPYHVAARRWWEGLVNGGERVGVPWVVSAGFVRLMTHPRVLVHPATPSEAVDYVAEWFRFPHVMPINPG
ncbi:MAG: VapC toxin family PIN domain ribonuclease, partial [Dehalococcoidia bacterium]|nr:VapC toxin family PIN domain ribonuclease [Dehalococcoidia bacterium]